MTSKEKGDAAVGFAISHYLAQGYEISLPIGDKRPYDFVLDKNADLLKVQVKFAGIYQPENKCVANLRVMGGNQSFHYVRKYKQNDFDILFVHTARSENYEIPWNIVKHKSTLTIESKKYRKYKV